MRLRPQVLLQPDATARSVWVAMAMVMVMMVMMMGIATMAMMLQMKEEESLLEFLLSGFNSQRLKLLHTLSAALACLVLAMEEPYPPPLLLPPHRPSSRCLR